jgi:hypothetical protein
MIDRRKARSPDPEAAASPSSPQNRTVQFRRAISTDNLRVGEDRRPPQRLPTPTSRPPTPGPYDPYRYDRGPSQYSYHSSGADSLGNPYSAYDQRGFIAGWPPNRPRQ